MYTGMLAKKIIPAIS